MSEDDFDDFDDDLYDNAKELGPFYFTVLRYRSKRFEIAQTNEVERPWRRGRGIAVRIRKTSFVFGVWKKTHPANETEGLLAALDGTTLEATPTEIGDWRGNAIVSGE